MNRLFILLLLQWTGIALAQDAQLVARIRAHMKETIDGVPNYTCEQLIERFRRSAGTGRKFEKLDALRLEVAVVNKHELFAWPGQNQFQDADLNVFSKRGAFGTGNFVTHISNALNGVGVRYINHGETVFAGKKAYRIGYAIPASRKPYSIRIGSEAGIAGVEGQFWVDIETLDVLRLELGISEIPEKLHLLGTREFVEYARVKIGSGDFLLPKKADLELEFIDGQIDKNKTTFNACRQYSGESTIRFDDGGITDETSKAPEEINVPAGSSIYVELKGKIDSAHSAIGDPVEFAVLRPVKVKGNVIVPKGALISGRISRMERAVYGGNVVRIIGFELNKITFGNKFSAVNLSVEEGGSVISSRFPNRPMGSRQRIFVFVEKENTPSKAISMQGNNLELAKGFLMVFRVN